METTVEFHEEQKQSIIIVTKTGEPINLDLLLERINTHYEGSFTAFMDEIDEVIRYMSIHGYPKKKILRLHYECSMYFMYSLRDALLNKAAE
jgi:hypothetical protein